MQQGRDSILDLVELIREEALRRPVVPCAACNASVDEDASATACFACGEIIHLDCAEDHLLSCEAPLAASRPLLVVRRPACD